MKKHFYVEYNSYGMISYNSFDGPGKNGYTFLQFRSLAALNNFLSENEFNGCNLVAKRCRYADVVHNLGKNFSVVGHVCVRVPVSGIDPGDLEDAQTFNNAFSLDKYEN